MAVFTAPLFTILPADAFRTIALLAFIVPLLVIFPVFAPKYAEPSVLILPSLLILFPALSEILAYCPASLLSPLKRLVPLVSMDALCLMSILSAALTIILSPDFKAPPIVTLPVLALSKASNLIVFPAFILPSITIFGVFMETFWYAVSVALLFIFAVLKPVIFISLPASAVPFILKTPFCKSPSILILLLALSRPSIMACFVFKEILFPAIILAVSEI